MAQLWSIRPFQQWLPTALAAVKTRQMVVVSKFYSAFTITTAERANVTWATGQCAPNVNSTVAHTKWCSQELKKFHAKRIEKLADFSGNSKNSGIRSLTASVWTTSPAGPAGQTGPIGQAARLSVVVVKKLENEFEIASMALWAKLSTAPWMATSRLSRLLATTTAVSTPLTDNSIYLFHFLTKPFVDQEVSKFSNHARQI